MLVLQSVRNYWNGIYVNVTVLETIGVVFMLMLQSVRNYWSDIYVSVTEC